MNNKIIILLLIILSSNSCKKPTNQIEGAWIAVESRHYDTSSWISPVNGLIFHFKNDSLKYSHVSADSIKSAQIEYLSNRKIVINYNSDLASDTFEIYQVSKDSITLLFYNAMLVKLVPIDLTNKSELSLQELIENDWEYIWDGDTSQVFFLNENFTKGFKTRKLCLAFENIEVYSLYTYLGSQFIPLTFGQTNNSIFQIEQIRGDTIFTKFFTNSSYIYPLIIKKKTINSIQANDLKNKLSGEWKTAELLNYGGGLGDSIGHLGMGNHFDETKLLSKKALIENGISFNFSKSTFQICENNNAIIDGKFKISNDGNYIILNKGVNPSDYVRIIELTNSELVISKEDEFSINSEGDYVIYYYELRLNKQGTT